MLSIGNTFLAKREVSTYETIERMLLSLPMRHSNLDVLYVPTGLILLTNTKINQITYIQYAQQILHPDMSAKKQMLCQ